jgi:hypothetical protein
MLASHIVQIILALVAWVILLLILKTAPREIKRKS